MFQAYALAIMTRLHLRQGQFTAAEAAIERGKIQSTRAFDLPFVILVEAELALRQRDYERALAATNDLPAHFHQFGLRVYIPEALYLRGKTLWGMGNTEAARNSLLEARAEAEAIGSRRMLWPILGTLSQLATDPTEAGRLRQQAQEFIQSIADSIGNPDLRASFLGLADVLEVMSL